MIAGECREVKLDRLWALPEHLATLTQFLQSNVSLVAGAVLLLVLMGIRTVTQDKDLRMDMKGASVLVIVFIILRSSGWLIEDHLSKSVALALRLGWMLTFAFGAIRFAVGVALWAFRFQKKTPTPKIVRDVLSFTLYALASLPIIKATLEIDLAGLVATSAILSVVLGLAMQDTLGNLFAGLSLQLERPFEVGDFVSIGKHTGVIAQIGWRATRIETFRNESITLPNNIIAKEAVKNFSRGAQAIGTDVYIGVALTVPPNRVKIAILETLDEIPDVLSKPAPHCRTWSIQQNSIRYQVRFFVANFEDTMSVQEQLHTRLWYRFEREGIELPLPQRVVHMRQSAPRNEQTPDFVLGLLHTVDLFTLLKREDLELLAREMTPRRFAVGERIITEGEPGNTFYIVASGRVSIRTGRPEHELASLGHGNYFGEMSLLTGEPRSASVVAAEDVLLYEVARPTFARILEAHPGLAQQLAELLGRRRTELRASAQNDITEVIEHAPETRRIFTRLRDLFGLADD